MNNDPRSYDQEADFEAFMEMLPELLKTHESRIVVLHERKMVRFFDEFVDAIVFGHERFGPGRYIAQVVEPADPKPISHSLAAMAMRDCPA